MISLAKSCEPAPKRLSLSPTETLRIGGEDLVLRHHESHRASRAWSVSYEDGTLVSEGASAADAVSQALELL